jgi:acyl carrier protein
MNDEQTLKTRAWLFGLVEDSQFVGEAVDSRLDAFLEGKQDLGIVELGLDSLALMQLCIDIEDKAGVQLSIEAVSHAKTLGQVLELINNGIAAT